MKAVGDGTTYTDSEVTILSYTKPAPEPVQLATPAGFSMQNSGETWALSWGSVENASGYQFRQTNGSGTWHSCSGSSYTFQNAPVSGDTYEVYAVGDGTSYTDSNVANYTYSAE